MKRRNRLIIIDFPEVVRQFSNLRNRQNSNYFVNVGGFVVGWVSSAPTSMNNQSFECLSTASMKVMWNPSSFTAHNFHVVASPMTKL